jgi:hypothetical protein
VFERTSTERERERERERGKEVREVRNEKISAEEGMSEHRSLVS